VLQPLTTPNPVPLVPLAQIGQSLNLPDVSGPVLGPMTTTGILQGSYYHCGEPGHYTNICLQAKYSQYSRIGYTDSCCPEPASSANIIPVACHIALDL
jgi:hypothetical protein